MTRNGLDEGRLICEVGVAFLRPAEFVLFRIGKKTAAPRNASGVSGVRIELPGGV